MQSKTNPQLNMVALASRIQPRPGELESARLHRTVVRNRLTNSFDVARIAPIGSHARETAVRQVSDLDMLVVLKRNEAKWGGDLVSSFTLIDRVRADLQSRFPATGVRRDQQAVVIDFAAGQQSLDVVPAVFQRMTALRPVYLIPDGLGDWLETSPEAHDAYFNSQVRQTGGKLRRVVQLMKWWKFSRAEPIPIRSFHVDVLLAASRVCAGVKPYTHCLFEAFRLLDDRECRSLRDPLGRYSPIRAASTDVQLQEVRNAVGYALYHSQAAVAAEAVRDFEEANRQWSIVFNGRY